jgi:hypothetical protein
LPPGIRWLIATYARATYYKSADWFKLDAIGSLYVRRGKAWDCLDFTKILFARKVAAKENLHHSPGRVIDVS